MTEQTQRTKAHLPLIKSYFGDSKPTIGELKEFVDRYFPRWLVTRTELVSYHSLLTDTNKTRRFKIV